MGGNALRSEGAVRISAELYQTFKPEFLANLARILPTGTLIECPTGYHNKPDHGDLDVVVSNECRSVITDVTVASELSKCYEGRSIPFKPNGPVTSFGVPTAEGLFQVDLIYTPRPIFNVAVDYYSWNDVGNLVGRIAHKMGLRYGHEGLTLPLRDGTNLFKTIHVSTNTEQILTFLGFDYDRYQRGFDSLESIYKFVASSKHFNADIYLLENRNHTARVRDRKRPTYTGFLQWINDNKLTGGYPFPQDKLAWLPSVFESFPETRALHTAAMEELALTRQAKEKFNGELAGEWTGLAGKELGLVMQRFAAQFQSKAERVEWILKTPLPHIRDRIEHLVD